MLLIHRHTLSRKMLMEAKSALTLPSFPEQKTGYCPSADGICSVAAVAGVEQQLRFTTRELHVTPGPSRGHKLLELS